MLTSLKNIVNKLNQTDLNSYLKIIEKINKLEDYYSHLSDDQLASKTVLFKQELANGKNIHDIKAEAFATVREASKRVLGLRHYDVQLIGGLALLDCNIAEMPTGEGKTLVASLPSYLRALEGKGVHVITVNEYLASRDKDLIGQVHEFLGLTVGLNTPSTQPHEKKPAYDADITYGVGTEFGFDYLRDNMVHNINERVQRPYHYAIIDEIDSVLIDEAKTPLIIANKKSGSSELYYVCAKILSRLVLDTHYTYDSESKSCAFTDEGITQLEETFDVENLYDIEHRVLYHYLLQALRAKITQNKDVEYIVEDGKVKLIDLYTGRIMDGRTLSEGLHQSIEAKEGLQITDENLTVASVTIQNYYRLYPLLSGMTGTAKTEEKEFQEVYGMKVISIPTNKPIRRIEDKDNVYFTIDQKDAAIIKEVKKRHYTGQPILIGTTSIKQSERLAKKLTLENINFRLLNAKSIEQEAEMISLAGLKGNITIATNMAGRGTDIILGDGVAELGGLCVIGTERHEARRIDNQLKGRAGRQGDPGFTQFFISLEDEMFINCAKEELDRLLPSIKTNFEGLVLNKNILEFVNKTQRIQEGIYYNQREYALKLDDIIRDQRKVIYTLREKLLVEQNLILLLKPYIWDSILHEIASICYDEEVTDEWDLETLSTNIGNIINNPEFYLSGTYDTKEQLTSVIKPHFYDYLKSLELAFEDDFIKDLLRSALIAVLDHYWTNHIDDMTKLKDGVGLKHYSQEDPLRIYQKEAFTLFEKMFNDLQNELSLQMTTAFYYSSEDEIIEEDIDENFEINVSEV
jgi:preprotein translocase subunit SecA